MTVDDCLHKVSVLMTPPTQRECVLMTACTKWVCVDDCLHKVSVCWWHHLHKVSACWWLLMTRLFLFLPMSLPCFHSRLLSLTISSLCLLPISCVQLPVCVYVSVCVCVCVCVCMHWEKVSMDKIFALYKHLNYYRVSGLSQCPSSSHQKKRKPRRRRTNPCGRSRRLPEVTQPHDTLIEMYIKICQYTSILYIFYMLHEFGDLSCVCVREYGI